MLKAFDNKEKFDSAAASRSPNARNILENDKWFGKTGAFEGSGYASTGLYRPSVDCIMFSKNLDHGFDAVCSRSIQKVIDFYCK